MTTSSDANELRCLASEIAHKLMESGEAIQLDLLKQMVDAALNRVIEQRRVPDYPSWGVGGGSQMETRAQRQWERQHGPPPGVPGCKVVKLSNGVWVRKI